MISPELQSFLESGISILVGTRDANRFPACVRAVGVRVGAGGTELLVFLPAATAATTLANAAQNGRLAVCCSRPQDHRTLQLKGQLLDVRPADERDRACIDRYRAAFAEVLAFVGLPPATTLRIAHWPSHALRMRIEQVFVQTPGPNAGEPLGRAPQGTRA